MVEAWHDTDGLIDNVFRASRLLRLTPGEGEILLALIRCDCPDEQGHRKGVVWCTPSKYLQNQTGRSRRNIQRTLASLEAKGAITCLTPENQGGRGNPHCWRINYRAMGWKEKEVSPPDKVHQSVPKVHQSVQESASICRTNPERILIITTLLSRRGP